MEVRLLSVAPISGGSSFGRSRRFFRRFPLPHGAFAAQPLEAALAREPLQQAAPGRRRRRGGGVRRVGDRREGVALEPFVAAAVRRAGRVEHLAAAGLGFVADELGEAAAHAGADELGKRFLEAPDERPGADRVGRVEQPVRLVRVFAPQVEHAPGAPLDVHAHAAVAAGRVGAQHVGARVRNRAAAHFVAPGVGLVDDEPRRAGRVLAHDRGRGRSDDAVGEQQPLERDARGEPLAAALLAAQRFHFDQFLRREPERGIDAALFEPADLPEHGPEVRIPGHRRAQVGLQFEHGRGGARR
ncbi:MAG: hypothetical protein IJV65_06905 [Kiritimatiellae bacterium]|nr:hypothetical protein [Kiritimatiellia bacterium]